MINIGTGRHSRSGEELAHIRAVCHNPADDAPRLCYTDWLEDRGRLSEAEVIRTQLHFRNDSIVRNAGSTLRPDSLWPEFPCTYACRIRRGFVHGLAVPGGYADSGHNPDDFGFTYLFEFYPIVSVVFADKEPVYFPDRLGWEWLRERDHLYWAPRSCLISAQPVWDRLGESGTYGTVGRGRIHYPTKRAALLDLSFVYVCLCRERSGLPAMSRKTVYNLCGFHGPDVDGYGPLPINGHAITDWEFSRIGTPL
jgi:uncharacterized protein (TIGR02996 family)